jgi:uncharacterized membrane protein YsdA (DUF1294 family)
MLGSKYLAFFLFYAVLNASSFALYGLDKFKAKAEKWRISERNLLVASLFGPLGAWLGMHYFKHKTQKHIFKFLIPLFVGLHVLLLFLAIF